ncbi:unnamed protein product, partial [Amoebophrya sp. A25]|eukprot:GSA25T00011073001.1
MRVSYREEGHRPAGIGSEPRRRTLLAPRVFSPEGPLGQGKRMQNIQELFVFDHDSVTSVAPQMQFIPSASVPVETSEYVSFWRSKLRELLTCDYAHHVAAAPLSRRCGLHHEKVVEGTRTPAAEDVVMQHGEPDSQKSESPNDSDQGEQGQGEQVQEDVAPATADEKQEGFFTSTSTFISTLSSLHAVQLQQVAKMEDHLKANLKLEKKLKVARMAQAILLWIAGNML